MARTVVVSRSLAIARILVASSLLVACGSYFLYLGWSAFADGEVLIKVGKGQNIRSHMTYAHGPTSEAFFSYIRACWLLLSVAIVLAGVALPLSLVLLSAKRRSSLIQFFGETTGGQCRHMPSVVAGLLAIALFGMLACEVGDRGVPPAAGPREKPPNISLGADTQQKNAAARHMLRAGQL